MPISDKERKKITLSIVFTFGEIEVLNSPADFKKADVIAACIKESDEKIAQAHQVTVIRDRSYRGIQKTGEPDWNKVQSDAKRKLGRKMLGEEE